MASKKCDLCNRLFNEDDKVKAVIVTRFAVLKSSVIWALKTPAEDCLELLHFNCQYPQGDMPDEA